MVWRLRGRGFAGLRRISLPPDRLVDSSGPLVARDGPIFVASRPSCCRISFLPLVENPTSCCSRPSFGAVGSVARGLRTVCGCLSSVGGGGARRILARELSERIRGGGRGEPSVHAQRPVARLRLLTTLSVVLAVCLDYDVAKPLHSSTSQLHAVLAAYRFLPLAGFHRITHAARLVLATPVIRASNRQCIRRFESYPSERRGEPERRPAAKLRRSANHEHGALQMQGRSNQIDAWSIKFMPKSSARQQHDVVRTSHGRKV